MIGPEKTEMVVREPMVMTTEEKTLEEYLTVGLLQMVTMLVISCTQFLGMAMGSVMISKDALAELMMTMKQGNMDIRNIRTVIKVKRKPVVFFFITSPGEHSVQPHRSS